MRTTGRVPLHGQRPSRHAAARRSAARAAVLASAALLLAGCAVRMGDVEHYVGPVLFRFRPPDQTVGAVTQVVRLGVSGEAGRQWGVAAGVVDRLAVVARSADEAAPAPRPRWTTPLSFLSPPSPGAWNVSLLYLRVEGMRRPTLVVRRTYGAEVTAGAETSALSIGWTARTRAEPPDHSFSVLRFDSRRPMDAVSVTWAEDSPPDPATWISHREVTP